MNNRFGREQNFNEDLDELIDGKKKPDFTPIGDDSKVVEREKLFVDNTYKNLGTAGINAEEHRPLHRVAPEDESIFKQRTFRLPSHRRES